MIRLLVDSSSDYSQEEIKEQGLSLVSLTISLAGKDYKGGIDLEGDKFYEVMQECGEFPMTSQPSPQDFLDVFKEAKEQGDELICILLSSGLSGTCQSAVLAKNMVDYDKIYIVDSLLATHLTRVLVEHAQKLIAQGLPAEEIVNRLEELKGRVKVTAMVDTLEYLYKGGRVSRATAVIGEAAKIKPIIHVNEEGKVGIMGKALGKNKAMGIMLKTLEETELDPEFPLYTVYAYGTENNEVFEAKMVKAGYHVAKRLQIGATIGAHVGPGAVGVIYVTK